MRHATQDDIGYLSTALAQLSLHVKKCGGNPHVEGLPTSPTPELTEFASQFVNKDDAIALIEESSGNPVGCLLAETRPSSFPYGGIGLVGHIAICWVEELYRQQGIASRLLSEAETWFKSNRIGILELSYMAQNQVAEDAWKRMGFTPFRVSSYKSI